jgi:hypothetical protein
MYGSDLFFAAGDDDGPDFARGKQFLERVNVAGHLFDRSAFVFSLQLDDDKVTAPPLLALLAQQVNRQARLV